VTRYAGVLLPKNDPFSYFPLERFKMSDAFRQIPPDVDDDNNLRYEDNSPELLFLPRLPQHPEDEVDAFIQKDRPQLVRVKGEEIVAVHCNDQRSETVVQRLAQALPHMLTINRSATMPEDFTDANERTPHYPDVYKAAARVHEQIGRAPKKEANEKEWQAFVALGAIRNAYITVKHRAYVFNEVTPEMHVAAEDIARRMSAYMGEPTLAVSFMAAFVFRNQQLQITHVAPNPRRIIDGSVTTEYIAAEMQALAMLQQSAPSFSPRPTLQAL
jgi:hypothetical protein